MFIDAGLQFVGSVDPIIIIIIIINFHSDLKKSHHCKHVMTSPYLDCYAHFPEHKNFFFFLIKKQ